MNKNDEKTIEECCKKQIGLNNVTNTESNNLAFLDKIYKFNANDLPDLITNDLEFKHNLFNALPNKDHPYIKYIVDQVVKTANFVTIQWLFSNYPELVGNPKQDDKYAYGKHISSSLSKEQTLTLLKRAVEEKNAKFVLWACNNCNFTLTIVVPRAFINYYGGILFAAMNEKEHEWFKDLLNCVKFNIEYRDTCITHAIELQCIDCLKVICEVCVSNAFPPQFLTMAAESGNLEMCKLLQANNVQHCYTLFGVQNETTRPWIQSNYKATIKNYMLLYTEKLYDKIFTKKFSERVSKTSLVFIF